MENILLFGKKFKVKISVKVVCFAATHRHNSLIRFFTLINTFFTSNNAIFNTITHTPLMIPPPPPPPPPVYKETTYTFLYGNLKPKLKKKSFFEILKS